MLRGAIVIYFTGIYHTDLFPVIFTSHLRPMHCSCCRQVQLFPPYQLLISLLPTVCSPVLACDFGPFLYTSHSQVLGVLYHYFFCSCIGVYSLFFQYCPAIWFSYPQLIRVINLFTEERINLPNFLPKFG